MQPRDFQSIIRRFTRTATAAALVALLSIVGCKTHPAGDGTFVAPAAQTTVRQFAGTALTGPQATAPTADADAGAWGVTARILAAQSLPGDPFQLIGPAAHLVVGAEPGNLLSPSAKLVYQTRFLLLKGDATAESSLPKETTVADINTLRGAVLVGSTVSFEIALPDGTPIDAKLSRRRVAIQVYRESSEKGYELALVSTDLAAGAKTASDLNQEKIIVHRSIDAGGDRLVLAIPMAFPQSTAAGVLVELSIDTKRPDAGTLKAARDDINATAQETAGRLSRPTVSPGEMAIAATLDAVGEAKPDKSLRRTLSYLAQQADAKLSAAVILVADDTVLQLIQGNIRDRMTKLPARDKPTVSWMLDRATIDAIASIKEEQAPTLLPPIIGALSIYAGEVGRQLDILQSLAKQSVNSDDLYARIIAEQQIALEDNSPAVRVRAYDWLNERGAGPAGYDPLGPGRKRRDALEKYHDVQATQPSIAK